VSTGSIDASEVRLAPSGNVYVAPVGSTAPVDSDTALTSAWVNLGYVTTEGVSITPKVDTTPIMMWQSATEVKRTIDKVSWEVSFTIGQTNRAVTSLFWMGATWASQPAGESKLIVPTNPTVADLESALVVEYTDDQGDEVRLYIPRGMFTERKEIKLSRKDPVVYGVTYVALDNSGSLGTLFTNSADLYT
jgi:hypothetical protein